MCSSQKAAHFVSSDGASAVLSFISLASKLDLRLLRGLAMVVAGESFVLRVTPHTLRGHVRFAAALESCQLRLLPSWATSNTLTALMCSS